LTRLHRYAAVDFRVIEERLEIRRQKIAVDWRTGLDPGILCRIVFPKMLVSVNAHGFLILNQRDHSVKSRQEIALDRLS
jgi:hypothetical protein